jgi:ceramide glucosyltransferase
VNPQAMVFLLLCGLVLGATCYSCIALYAALRFRAHLRSAAPWDYTPPVSLIKPLCGVDRELRANLESFCRMDYSAYELLFSVRDRADPAVSIVEQLQRKFPSIPMRLIFTGDPRYPNAKVHGLEEMIAAAAHDVLVISDSDVRVSRDYLRAVVGPLSDTKVGLVTCLSRGIPANEIWSRLEALGMNTQFMSGVLSAWLLIGMKFALGPTMAVRKKQVEGIGGARVLGDYLADDFVLGEMIANAGYRVVIPPNIPEHLFGGSGRKSSLGHRLRWERSSRMSRPGGYVGQIFMHSLPLVLLAALAAPAGSSYAVLLFVTCLMAHYASGLMTGWAILRDPLLRRYWWLLPVQDLLAFGIWCWGFVGREIEWRGARFTVLRGGKLVRIAAAVEHAAHASEQSLH